MTRRLDPLVIHNRSPLEARLFSRLTEDQNGCWIFADYRKTVSYGVISHLGRPHLTHRVAWEILRGEIPDDLQLDHLCRVPACCNPWHLEPVTPRVNTRRSPIALAALNAIKTHCPRGHSYDSPEVLYIDPTGRRHCRPCRAAEKRQRRARAA